MCLVWIKVQPQSQRCSLSCMLLFHYNNMSSAKHLSVYLSIYHGHISLIEGWNPIPQPGGCWFTNMVVSVTPARRARMNWSHECSALLSSSRMCSGPTSCKIPYQLVCLPALLRWSSLVTSLAFPEMEMLSHFMILLQPKAASPSMQQSAEFIHLCGLAWRGALSQS